MKQAESDFSCWQSQSFTARLEALEEVRGECDQWKYHVDGCYPSRSEIDTDGVQAKFIDLENLTKQNPSQLFLGDCADFSAKPVQPADCSLQF